MDKRISAFSGSVYVLCNVMAMNLVFLVFFVLNSNVPPALSLPVWTGCALLCFLGNFLLLTGRAPSLPVLVLGNVGLLALSLTAILSTGKNLTAGCTAAAVLLMLTTQGIAVYRALRPVGLTKLLTQIDVLVLCTVGVAVICLNGSVNQRNLLAYLLTLLLSLCATLFMRIFEGGGSVLYGSRLRGALLCCGILGGVGLLLLVFVRFLAESSRSAVSVTVRLVLNALQALGGLLGRFFAWLATLVPVDETAVPVDPLAPAGGADMSPSAENVLFDPTLLTILGGVLAVAVIAALVLLVIKLRKTRIHLAASQAQPITPVERTRQPGALRRRISALLFALRFRLHFLVYRGTPSGMLVWLSRWGTRNKMPRVAGETPRAYLMRLAAVPGFEGDDALRQSLATLANALDLQYYGGTETKPLPGRQLADLRKRFSAVRLPEEKPAEQTAQRP